MLPPASEFCRPREPLAKTVLPMMVNLQQLRTYIIARSFFSWTGNDYVIRDTFGVPQCIAAGKAWSMRDRAMFKDLQGNLVCVVLRKMFSVHHAYYIYVTTPVYPGQVPCENQDGIALFRYAKVEQKPFSMHEKSRLMILLPPVPGVEENWVDLYDIERPGAFSNNLMVYDAGLPLDQGAALLDREKIQFAACEEWAVTVAPGVDPVLMFAVIMITDEIRDQRREAQRHNNGRYGGRYQWSA